MKLALLIGNRYTPWHFQVYGRLRDVEVTVFRAESEIQQYFDERGDCGVDQSFQFERIYFNHEKHAVWSRLVAREPRIVPFRDRLKQFDLVQTWELFTDWSDEAVASRCQGGPPVAVMVWDNIPFNMDSDSRRRAIKQRVKREADLFIVHTELSRKMLRIEGVADEKIVCLPPAVDTERFSPGNTGISPPSRSEETASPSVFSLLFVGWFLPRKGLPVLLQALRGLLEDAALRARAFRLGIVGSGPGKRDIDALIDRLQLREVCRFLGSVPYAGMPAVYRAADLFVFPSVPMPEWQEQFGMALIEAMSCGVPVVSTYSGAIPEIAGDAAMLCPPGEPPALQAAIKRIVLDAGLRAGLSEAGRRRALERYTLDALAHGLQNAYRRIL